MAFSNDRNDNVVTYWGQDSAGHQQNLGFYCNDDAIDVLPLAFLYIFFGKGGQPVIDFANICSQGSNDFPGTDLADCSFMAADIRKCQAQGKIITLSLGGATAKAGFSSDSQAAGFATTIWNMFLGGNGAIRPFGNAVLDGVDLDIENGSPAHYNTFVNTLRSLANNAHKRFCFSILHLSIAVFMVFFSRYYITAAPQCPFPDAEVGNALNSASFDAVYVQFYNNFCETSAPSEFNFATWDNWAKTQSPNKDIKVYLGAPGSADSAGEGYVSSQTLINVALEAQKKYSSFGGIMLWDADSAYTNNKYHAAVKNAIINRSEGSSSPSPNPSAEKPAPTTHAPNPAPVSSKSSSPVQSPIPDPRLSGRVRRPTISLDQRHASPAPTAAGQLSPRKG
ncbi:glycoside hydrolase superfamily [Gymnopilus junonius]|uniref:chitinase n=1 Tax=Gymnopilus junonius TaxID=109634 RepID=A0A9P5TJE2_GYMJU|nr:glycoside hydrolase superfamily [Gymnopilus junonius]